MAAKSLARLRSSALCAGGSAARQLAPRRWHASGPDPGGTRSLVEAWADRVARTGMVADDSQRAAVERLEQYDREAGLGDRCALRPWAYLYGSVGSGKTLLLDHYAAHSRAAREGGGAVGEGGGGPRAPAGGGRVLRAHFHDFMLSVHEQLHALQARRPKRVRKTLSGLDVYEFAEPDGASAADTLVYVAAKLAERADVICLDELCVTDLADALMLSRLARALLHEGVRLVFTSNQPPARLFDSGEDRARYVGELSALLRARCVPVRVGKEGVDYRALGAARLAVEGAAPPPAPRTLAHRASGRLFAGGAESAAAFDRCWAERAGAEGGERKASLAVAFARRWALERTTGASVRLHFDEACARGRGAADYLSLARAYTAVHVGGVPALCARREDEARRLITLVDVCYDWQVRLVLHAEVPREELFAALRAQPAGGGGGGPPQGELEWMITRCQSRLVEMAGEAESHGPG